MQVDISLEDILQLKESKNLQIQGVLQAIHWGHDLNALSQKKDLRQAIFELVYSGRQSGGITLTRRPLQSKCLDCKTMFPKDAVILHNATKARGSRKEVGFCAKCFENLRPKLTTYFEQFEDEMEIHPEILGGRFSKYYRVPRYFCLDCRSKLSGTKQLVVTTSPFFEPHILRCAKCRSHRLLLTSRFVLRPSRHNILHT